MKNIKNKCADAKSHRAENYVISALTEGVEPVEDGRQKSAVRKPRMGTDIRRSLSRTPMRGGHRLTPIKNNRKPVLKYHRRIVRGDRKDL